VQKPYPRGGSYDKLLCHDFRSSQTGQAEEIYSKPAWQKARRDKRNQIQKRALLVFIIRFVRMNSF